jgi:hypothetical protein
MSKERCERAAHTHTHTHTHTHAHTHTLSLVTLTRALLTGSSPPAGGMCPDNSDALYANDFPKAYSKKMLINHGEWITKKELIKEKQHAEQAQHHHFS